jgi:hypothetical protein
MNRYHLRLTLAFSVSCLLTASPLLAQSGIYVGGSGFADIREFGSSGQVYALNGEDNSLDATGAGGALRVGTWLHPRWTLELGLEMASRTTVDFEPPFVIQIFPLPRIDAEASSEFTSVTAMVGFHPPKTGRLAMGYLAGFSFVQAEYSSQYPRFPVPLATISGNRAAATSIGIGTVLPSGLIPMPFEQEHNAGAFALGVEAAIDLTTKLALVPEARALVFSVPANGPTIFLIRPGVAVRWTF